MFDFMINQKVLGRISRHLKVTKVDFGNVTPVAPEKPQWFPNSSQARFLEMLFEDYHFLLEI